MPASSWVHVIAIVYCAQQQAWPCCRPTICQTLLGRRECETQAITSCVFAMCKYFGQPLCALGG